MVWEYGIERQKNGNNSFNHSKTIPQTNNLSYSAIKYVLLILKKCISQNAPSQVGNGMLIHHHPQIKNPDTFLYRGSQILSTLQTNSASDQLFIVVFNNFEFCINRIIFIIVRRLSFA